MSRAERGHAAPCSTYGQQRSIDRRQRTLRGRGGSRGPSRRGSTGRRRSRPRPRPAPGRRARPLPPPGHVVERQQVVGGLRSRGGRLAPADLEVGADDDAADARPPRLAVGRERVELRAASLPGAQRSSSSTKATHAVVARSARRCGPRATPAGRSWRTRSHRTRRLQRGRRPCRRTTLVDHDHLHGHVPLPADGAERPPQQGEPVPGRHHDRHRPVEPAPLRANRHGSGSGGMAPRAVPWWAVGW